MASVLDELLDAAAKCTVETDPATLVRHVKALGRVVHRQQTALVAHQGVIVAFAPDDADVADVADILERLDRVWSP